MTDPCPPARYERAPGCVHRAFRGSVLLLDDAGAAFELAGASAAVWITLDRPGGLDDVVSRLDEIGLPPDADARSSLAEALGALSSSGLVREVQR